MELIKLIHPSGSLPGSADRVRVAVNMISDTCAVRKTGCAPIHSQ